MPEQFNIVAVVQGGRLQYEALLFAASLRHTNPALKAKVFLAEPQPGPRWNQNPKINDPDLRKALKAFDVEIVPFQSRHFGSSYPHGNKIEALAALPENEPFVFFDTDTLFLGDLSSVPFDFNRPSASMRREDTWPKIELYGPGYAQIWKSLYDRFGLDFESSLDLSQPDEYWERYLYFNAGWFFGRCPREFGALFSEYAVAVRDNPPPELECQSLDPWLDQVVLPLVIHRLGGGRDTLPPGLLDGSVTCHWRVISLLFARESDQVVDLLQEISAPNRIKKLLKQHEPFKRMIYQGRGQKIRDMFDRTNLPRKEHKIRKQIKEAKLWMR